MTTESKFCKGWIWAGIALGVALSQGCGQVTDDKSIAPADERDW